jgi:hypothetical protein
MAGKEVKEVEEGILEELRDRLQSHIKKFIRENEGGPWPSIQDQEALRLDIESAPTVASLVMLTEQILKERDRWFKANTNPISRFFSTHKRRTFR